MWDGYYNYDHYYTYSQKEEWFEEISFNDLEIVKTARNKEYYNIPSSFDIETSSFKDKKNNKHAVMYLWCYNINGSCIIGREWGEFTELLEYIQEKLNLDSKKRILITYIHNLGYEFQWFQKRIPWCKIFNIKNRRPIYALSQLGIEFRCSYLLSNYSLEYLGREMLHKYPVTKKVGFLDYKLVRSPITPLTDKEILYQCDDTRVVTSFIQEKIENDGNILKLPLTNTGYVRNYCRNCCLNSSKKEMFKYKLLMQNLQIKSEKEYDQLKKAFSGGFTHANPMYSGKVLENVGSADLTSSYPFTMVADYFPMSGGYFIGEVNDEDVFEYYIKNMCCLFTVKINGLYSEVQYDSYISESHCSDKSDDAVVNNGRVVSASYVQLNITELDWDIISKIYNWESVEIFNMRIYERGYLPKSLILSILSLYKNKTSLKGIEEKQVEYLVSKNMINAAFGMAVTDIVRDEIIYDEEKGWQKESADAISQLKKYNSKFDRFLSYAWGVWVTAHARHHLWECIFEFGDDYVYSDTDSVKGLNFDKHLWFFEDYNLSVYFKLKKVCSHYNIDFELCTPKTIKGEEKMIGVWDIERGYDLFKTIGAKRYMYKYADIEKNGQVDLGEFNITTAGINKKYAVPYLLWKYGTNGDEKWLKILNKAYKEEDKKSMEIVKNAHKNGEIDYIKVLNAFRTSLYIPEGFTGKNTLTYLDYQDIFEVTDYKGLKYMANEYTSLHMEPQSYFFTMTEAYLKYIMDIQTLAI